MRSDSVFLGLNYSAIVLHYDDFKARAQRLMDQSLEFDKNIAEKRKALAETVKDVEEIGHTLLKIFADVSSSEI